MTSIYVCISKMKLRNRGLFFLLFSEQSWLLIHTVSKVNSLSKKSKNINNFWPFSGPFLGSFMSISGPLWSRFGHFLILFGFILVTFWPFLITLVHIWSKSCQFLITLWSLFGQIMITFSSFLVHFRFILIIFQFDFVILGPFLVFDMSSCKQFA